MASLFLVSGLIVQWLPTHYWHPDRSAEEQAGSFIADRLPADEPIIVSTADYGYFALMASGTHPERFTILERHDPREQNSQKNSSAEDHLSTAKKIREELDAHEAHWALVSPPLLKAAQVGLQTASTWDLPSSTLVAYRLRDEFNRPIGGSPQAASQAKVKSERPATP